MKSSKLANFAKSSLRASVSRDLKPTILDRWITRSGETTAIVFEQSKPLEQLTLKLLGKHNLSNALVVVAIGRLLEPDSSFF